MEGVKFGLGAFHVCFPIFPTVRHRVHRVVVSEPEGVSEIIGLYVACLGDESILAWKRFCDSPINSPCAGLQVQF